MANKCHERSMQVQKSLGKNTCLKQTEVICWKYGKTISFSANNYIYSVYRAAASLCCQSRFSEPCTDCVQPHCRWYFASWGPCFHNLTTTGGQGVCVVEIQSEKPQRKEKSAFRQRGGRSSDVQLWWGKSVNDVQLFFCHVKVFYRMSNFQVWESYESC